MPPASVTGIMTRPDPEPVAGLHRATTVAGDPDANPRFFRATLGLRPLERTVDRDDVTTYHDHCGDGDTAEAADAGAGAVSR